MKSIHPVFFLLLSLTVNLVAEDEMHGAVEQQTKSAEKSSKRGLNFPSNAIPLAQSDFDTGPYRIKTPGYYYLTEDISFDQSAGRTEDRPRTGAWFAAISVECDNVIIDLNSYTLECTQNFVEKQDFKVFSMIELANSPFPHLVFAYSDVTKFKAAHNVEIKNGALGRSPHHGIHGNMNTDVNIHDLVARDWEVAAISLNGLKNGIIKNINISGIEHNVAFTGLVAVIQSALVELYILKAKGDENAQAYIDALEVMAASSDPNQSGRGQLPPDHDGNCYGIFLNRTVDVGPLPSGHCDDGTINCVSIENVTVCNMVTSIIETVGMLNADGQRMKSIPFGTLRWYDAYAGEGDTFAPNALLRAQAYVMQQNPSQIDVPVPDGFIENILSDSPSEELFVSQVRPAFNGDFATHTNKGAFGIRVDCGHGVSIKNCRVYNLQALGELGKELSSIPGGSNYPDYEEIRYKGNDVHGFSLVGCRNCTISNSSTFECTSSNGYVYGVMVMNEAEGNIVANTYSSDHYVAHDDINSVVNPSARVYGVYVANDCIGNRFRNVRTQLLQSPRYAYGMWVDNCTDTQFIDCKSAGHRVVASENLSAAKESIGFVSQASECTLFHECHASNMRCLNESGQETSPSLAAGFVLRAKDDVNERYATIHQSFARCCNSGAGTAVGIRLDGTTEAGVTESYAITSHGETSGATGYGIQDRAADSHAMILKNIAYGNATANYDVQYTDGRSLPLYEGSYALKNNIKLKNPWEVSLANREIVS